jgi:predicted Zn-dependent peptidase
VDSPVGPRSLLVMTPVQADRTADSIRLLMAQMKDFPGKKPARPDEVLRVTDGNVRGLPNRFETNAQVLAAIVQNDRLGRPDDYVASLPGRYRAIDATALDTAARSYLQPDALTIVVVGDRKLVEPQLRRAGLAATYQSAPASGN